MRLVYFLFCKLLILVLCSLFFWGTFINLEELFMYYTLEPFLTNAIFYFLFHLFMACKGIRMVTLTLSTI